VFSEAHPKQNTVARLKTNILPPNIWAGYATARVILGRECSSKLAVVIPGLKI